MGYHLTTYDYDVSPKTHTPGSPVKERGYHLTTSDYARTQQSATKYPRAYRKPHGGPKTDWVLSTKYTDSETGLLYYGYRYYQSETGRWVGRDRMGEHKDPNLFCFVQNNVTTRLDYLGLITIDDSLEDCKNKVEEWKGLKNGVFHAPFGLTNPWILFYLRFLTCDVNFTCTKCCSGSENGSTQGYESYFRRTRSCDINLCANNMAQNGRDVQSVLAHELTHCFQYCNNNKMVGCASCMCTEIQAYHRGDPSLTLDQLIDAAVGSCGPKPQGNGECDYSGIASQRGKYTDHPELAKRCSNHGTGP